MNHVFDPVLKPKDSLPAFQIETVYLQTNFPKGISKEEELSTRQAIGNSVGGELVSQLIRP